MIRKIREYYCEMCNGTRILGKCEEEPEICPFCGRDKNGRICWTQKYECLDKPENFRIG